MSLNVKFKTSVIVPRWEYCNKQRDATHKEGDWYCEFMTVTGDERGCRLFNESLYASYGWVKKCDKCIKRSIDNEDIELIDDD